MAGGCRECGRCIESSATSMMWMPLRLIGWVSGGFLFGFFRKRCPQCSHFLSGHQRMAGRLAD